MNPAIRMVGRWGSYRVGEILRPTAGLRKVLFSLKVAVAHEDKPAAPGQAMMTFARAKKAK